MMKFVLRSSVQLLCITRGGGRSRPPLVFLLRDADWTLTVADMFWIAGQTGGKPVADT